MPGDRGEESNDERRLRLALEALDKEDPEVVKQTLLQQGALEHAFDSLKNLANSEDPLIREYARQYIDERQLGFLLAEETDERFKG